MSAQGGSSSSSRANPLVLCWFDTPTSRREEFVQMLESHFSEAVISSSLRVQEKTEVSLIGSDYNESGVVRSCLEQGSRFIVTIRLASDRRAISDPDRDPGVLAVDDFVTEEQELQILRELEQELGIVR